ncbi:MAG TPA: hypothetical protein ENI29_15955 [bacterium]|nr:hypothetical protein [bacterium]
MRMNKEIILQEHVNALKSTVPQSSYERLFPFKHGMLSVTFSRMKLKQLEEASNMDAIFKRRLYDLRHAAITNFYLKGLSDQEVRRLLLNFVMIMDFYFSNHLKILLMK